MSDILAGTEQISIRKISGEDLNAISGHAFTVSITEPHEDLARLEVLFAQDGFWQDDAGAIAIVEKATGRLVGTSQYYRSGPCIHGLELGYIIHAESDRCKGYATEATGLFSDFLFCTYANVHRHQLTIEVDKAASVKVAERCGFTREGVLRNCGFDPDNPADCYVYSKTRADFLQEQ